MIKKLSEVSPDSKFKIQYSNKHWVKALYSNYDEPLTWEIISDGNPRECRRVYADTEVEVIEKDMNKQEIEHEIEKLKREGINADQEDKSPMEDYVDTIAAKRMIQELEEKLEAIEWAENGIKKLKQSDSHKLFTDMITAGANVVNVDDAGNVRIIEQYSEEYWQFIKKIEDKKNGTNNH